MMHVGNFQAAGGRLQESLEQLQLAWANTSEVWQDANSQGLDEQHLRPLFEELTSAIPAISHMMQVVQSAQRDLEES